MICPECKYEPPVHRGPDFGTPIKMPGTTHYADCPLVPRLSSEAIARLNAKFDDIDRARRRAMAEMHTYVIG